MTQSVVHVLEEDPDLAGGLTGARLEAARRHLRAAEITVPGPAWSPPRPARPKGHLGLLVLEGLVVRRVSVHGSDAWEPLGPGDVLQPWEDDTARGILQVHSSYTVLAPARLAELDARFGGLLAHWPELIGAYGSRLIGRSRCLADLWAIDHHTGAAQRVHLLLWFFADRWGRMTPQGPLVPFALTHQWLARFAGARRPTITLALSQLSAAGIVSRHPATKGWIIHHAPHTHHPPTPTGPTDHAAPRAESPPGARGDGRRTPD